MDYNLMPLVAVDAAQSLSPSVAVSIGSMELAEAADPAAASPVETRAAALLPCSCRNRRRGLTAGRVAERRPWS